MSSRRVLAAVFCVVTTASLAACGTDQIDQIGAAAVVGRDRITVAELQQQVEDLAESLPDGGAATGDQSAAQQAILERMIQGDLLAAVARDEGVDVTEAEIDTFIDEQVVSQAPDGDLGPLLAQNNLTETSLRDAVRNQLLAQKLIDKLGGNAQLFDAITAKAKEIGVTVNPRYGKWNGVTVEATSGSISTPALAPAAETPTG